MPVLDARAGILRSPLCSVRARWPRCCTRPTPSCRKSSCPPVWQCQYAGSPAFQIAPGAGWPLITISGTAFAV